MDIGRIIAEYRQKNHLSLRQFAAKCEGISSSYVAILETGRNASTGKPSYPSIDKLKSLAAGMDMTFDQLRALMNDDPAPGAMTISMPSNAIPYTPGRALVPIIGTVRCGPGGLAFEELQGAEMADVANPAEYYFLRAAGDSMSPAIEPGDLALVHVQPQVDNGQLAVVIVDGEEGTLKRFIREGSTVILQSLNTAYPPRVFVGDEINTLTVAGRVVETKRKW